MTSSVMVPISSFSASFQARENLKPTTSNVATRQFPLTATTSILQDQLVPEPDSLSSAMEHYNSRGEIIHYPPFIYPFPLVYPSPPPLPSISLPRDNQCRVAKVASHSPAPITALSSRSTTLTTNPTTSATTNPPLLKKRPKPGPRCRVPSVSVSSPYSNSPLSLKWRKSRPLPIPHHSVPSNASIAATAATIPAVGTTTAPRPCATPSCARVIPIGSSTLTRHCPPCVKADWDARKVGIKRYLQVAHTVAHEGVQVKKLETVERPGAGGPGPGRSRSDSNASMSSLSSLSTLTSSDDSDEDGDRSIDTPATTIDESQDPTPPLLPAPSSAPTTTSKHPPPKLTLRFRSALYHNVKSFRYCCDTSCSRKLDKEYAEVRCVPCRARGRQRRMELVEGSGQLRRKRVGGGDMNETDKDEGEEEETLDVVPGARLCVVRWCTHILPPREEYKPDTCVGCRRFFSSVRGGKNAKESWNGSTGGDLAPGRKRCASLDCGVVVVESYGSGSLCMQCTKRKAREMNRVDRVRARRKTREDASHTPCDEISTQICIPTIPKIPPMYPEYDGLHSLSVHFRTLLYEFLSDQVSLALRHKSSPTTPTPDPAPVPPTTLFTFSGQFSAVSPTPDLTHPTYKPTILRHITHIRTKLERASHFRLQPQNPHDPLVAFKHGFAMRFTCLHSIPLGLFAPGVGDGEKLAQLSERGTADDKESNDKEKTDPEDAIRRDIKGELDVITVSDDSHGVIPGQMTVVRFRMGVVDAS